MCQGYFLNIPVHSLSLHDPSFLFNPQPVPAVKQYAHSPRENETKAKVREQRHKATAYEFLNRLLKLRPEIIVLKGFLSP